MNRRELIAYHSELAKILNSEPNRSERKEFLVYERTTERYKFAKEQARLRNLIKPILPVAVWDLPNEDRTEELVDRLIIIIWSKEVLNQYNDLPKANSQERKRVRNLVTQTAGRLLENPQDISIAEKMWATTEAEQNIAQESEEPFSTLVRKECCALIKDKWEDVKPEQLAQLVRISADGLLRNYFKGPSNRRQRIDAYCTLAYAVLHLIEDDKAFTQAIRIGLHDTDILPKDPNLIEQTLLLSLPYNEEERVFQKLLIAKNVMFKLSFLSSEDLGEVRQKHYDFLSTNEKLKKKWKEEQARAIKQIGSAKLAEINNATVEFDLRREDALSEEEKLQLKNIWPFNLFFDETDPLNIKLQKVLSQKDELLNRSKKPPK